MQGAVGQNLISSVGPILHQFLPLSTLDSPDHGRQIGTSHSLKSSKIQS